MSAAGVEARRRRMRAKAALLDATAARVEQWQDLEVMATELNVSEFDVAQARDELAQQLRDWAVRAHR